MGTEFSNQSYDISVVNTSSTTSSTTFPTALSNLYIACRHNHLEDAKRLLETASLADINRIEPHRSRATALHAASYYGHAEIVKLLLSKGATRTIYNNYGFIPYEEAKSEEIKQLFARIPHTKRFGGLSGSIEWNVIDPAAAKIVSEYKETEKKWFIDVCSDNDARYLKEIERYVRKKLTDIEGIEQVYYLIDQAIKEKSILPVLKAYTLQTGFYSALNFELASNNSVKYIENDMRSHDEYFRYWHGPGGYAALIAHHPTFQEYSFTGTSYRGMIMLETDIQTYKTDTFVINKAFLSTSTDRKIAKSFALPVPLSSEDTGNIKKYPAICTYKVRNLGTAIDISSISDFPREKEVLIMPRTAFRVASIGKKWSITRQATILIVLHECGLEKFIDTASSINVDDPYY